MNEGYVLWNSQLNRHSLGQDLNMTLGQGRSEQVDLLSVYCSITTALLSKVSALVSTAFLVLF
jgi:hypothetical protein